MNAAKRMWGGRFTGDTDLMVQAFNASIDVDRELALDDLSGSEAHARMLGEQGIVPEEDAAALIAGLRDLRGEVEAGTFDWQLALEDVHMNLEAALTQRIGPVGGRLHTARSRNDQVATDFRMWLRRHVRVLLRLLRALRRVLVDLAEAHLGVVMPGYTHLQVAQPVLFSHHVLAWQEMLARDEGRLRDGLARMNVSPLGAGALAGTTFPIDRHRTAALLGFARPADNSMDAVSDRDFAIEFLAAASLCMMHLSRMSEELILWSTQEFGFVTLPDSHTTGSSIMPQKKNPDVSELIRGKTGRVYGALMASLTVMKGLPLAYNKDMQEDKEGVFDAVATLRACLTLQADMLPRTQVNAERMRAAAAEAYANATDLADYLVRKGRPFREAHERVGRLVRTALERGVSLEALPLETMRAVDDAIEADVYGALALEQVVAGRTSYGGTAQVRVRERIDALQGALAEEAPEGEDPR
ncbi:MAG: argininosuccinate lyase [Trueperaceae bacterium]|nr:argininosuccinate lyase [Trueperaceae bacterium]